MRILFWVRAGNKYGGLEKYIVRFSELCKNRGHQFILLNEIENSNYEYINRLIESNAEQIVIGESIKNPLQVYSKATYFIRKWKPDAIQLYFVNSMVIPILRILRIPLIYQTYLSGIDHDIKIHTRLLRIIDNLFSRRVLSVSERVRKDEIRAGVNPNIIETLYMGLPIDEILDSKDNVNIHYPIGWDDPFTKKIVSVGRFYPEKGMRYVVEAAIKVAKERSDLVWWLIGQDGPESELCINMIQEASLENRIEYIGLVEDVLPYVMCSYVQVVGSLYEGLPFVPLESSVCGVPTIGTQIGGMDEAIISGETGILVERKSSIALANAVFWMLDNPSQRNRMGDNAKKFVSENFDSNKQINKLLDLFQKDYYSRSNKFD